MAQRRLQRYCGRRVALNPMNTWLRVGTVCRCGARASPQTLILFPVLPVYAHFNHLKHPLGFNLIALHLDFGWKQESFTRSHNFSRLECV